MSEGLSAAIEWIYDESYGFIEDMETWSRRESIKSLGILTITEPQPAFEVAEWLAPEIRDKLVVEIGAGVGLLACEMAKYAKHVYAVEAEPGWSWAFTKYLYRSKPVNLTWIFGRAQDVADWLRCDVAVIVTRSDHAGMQEVAGKIAVSTIDVIDQMEEKP